MAADKFLPLTPEIHRYVVDHCSHRDELVRLVEDAADSTENPLMQIAGDQAALISVIVAATGARRALEVGTFLGYGAIAIARSLPADGELVCCEIDPGHAATARAHLERAGLADRVEIRLGPALETLREMPSDGRPFDFCFIDADKTGYADYLTEALRLLSPGGLVMLDNTLLDGRVLDPRPDDDDAVALARLNDSLAGDPGLEVAMVGAADGITLVRKLD